MRPAPPSLTISSQDGMPWDDYLKALEAELAQSRQLRSWNKENGAEPENSVGALYGFIKQKVKREGGRGL